MIGGVTEGLNQCGSLR